MPKRQQLNVEIPVTLQRRISRDSAATNRSVKAIVGLALNQFYNLPIPERSALLLRTPGMKSGRRATC